ncbi:unnamed protein product [Prorocentrum cordatum]|uniref:Protein kinase domain-containing protein n=1 Tax=Prorocentrum cordatum TaxID=2364126 RepID=A0ABN9QVC4_9DINO|nr:unnamed protein product [Polarella glacialis]
MQSPYGGASVAELKRRARELHVEIPADLFEKGELVRLVEAAEQHARGAAGSGAAPTPSGAAGAPRAGASRSHTVAELKARLRELNLEVPTTIVEKSELQELVLEAERQRARPAAAARVSAARASAAAEAAAAAAEQLPYPWMTKEDLPKHDYRDDAFGDAAVERVPDVAVSSGRAWSRSGSVVAERGPLQRVASLQVEATDAAPSTEGAALSPGCAERAEDVVVGSQLTWVRNEMIGRGSLGKVFRALDKATGRTIAVKEVPIDSNDADDQEYREALENEIEIMRDLKHPRGRRVLGYLGHDYLNGSVYIYLEHMPGGTLTQALQQYGPFEESLMARYSKQLLDGLEYMHTLSPSIVHRDIKGSNILISPLTGGRSWQTSVARSGRTGR